MVLVYAGFIFFGFILTLIFLAIGYTVIPKKHSFPKAENTSNQENLTTFTRNTDGDLCVDQSDSFDFDSVLKDEIK